MARARRIFLENISVHVIARGNNKARVFHQDDDYHSFIELLRRSATRAHVAVHAFVLMSNHYHLLVTPGCERALPTMMKAVNGGYTRYYNGTYRRLGTPWNGRYRGRLVDDERYWLTCLRYIEQNPVRAGMVASADEYPWSSCRSHATEERIGWLTDHPLFLSLGRDVVTRQAAYRALVDVAVPPTSPLLVR